MRDDHQRTVRLQVEVEDCGTAYLADGESIEDVETPAHSAGIIEVEKSCVTLRITHQWGPADFTVTVADRDPGADREGYEDIVEVSYVSGSGRLELTGFSFDEHVMHPLPALPAGPGAYRIRYHVKGLDSEGTQDAADDHYLQIWPAPIGDPVVVKTTTEMYEYYLDPEKFERRLRERAR
ncbi:hypothetical protein AAH991_11565 [Microbispora sp. ZYX-F-249]|uniref:Uncharacterized protein n=1 Tax=Microbispora maris TaxID=3144104 RepID=A0ABV0AME0_9ACTN